MTITKLNARSIFTATVLIMMLSFTLHPQSECYCQSRTEINIPDILGYKTLKCDFHMHSVFSDGTVWPTIRPEEAWCEGMDAIAITDHIEHKPFKKDVTTSGEQNRSYDIALPAAEQFDIILIRGAEITRNMPPGHFNTIFLQDADALDKEDYMDAFKSASSQNAFIFWNHPGWLGQQPDGVAKWYELHTSFYDKGWMHGIEIVNNVSYYPEVHQWCIDKKLTMLASSDVHKPIQMIYDIKNGEHRPMTLVFAKERSSEAIKEALFDRRTVVYYEDKLIGEDKYLKAIFENSVQLVNPKIHLDANDRKVLRIRNNSAIPYRIVCTQRLDEFSIPDKLLLKANSTVIFRLRNRNDSAPAAGVYPLHYRVENLLTAPGQGLNIQLPLNIVSN